MWVADAAWIFALLWLGRRLAAVALIRPLAWEPPQAADAALKSKKMAGRQPERQYLISPA